MLRVLAVDCGASSVRVAAVDLDAAPPTLEIVHQYHHAPVRAPDGSLRWDWRRLVDEVERGVEAGLARGPVASIGVDAWGVDYGLLGGDGRLISAPYCYRDNRTSHWRDVVERIGAGRLYASTGIQLMQINTIFQLAAHERSELARARRLLMLPELLIYELTGVVTGERTSAGTTGLVDIRTGGWWADALEAIDVDPEIMPPIGRAGAHAGSWRGVPVHLVAGHDTASAFTAAPAITANTVIISSGTWMVLGVERDAPDTSAAAMRANFSNEPAVFGGVRFVKNIMGTWMLDRCLAAWGSPPLGQLVDAAAALPAGGPTVDATDARFLAPDDMEVELRDAAGLSEGRDRVVRCVLDSLGAAVARTIDELRAFTGEASEIVVVGGGSQNWLLNQLIEDACKLPVRVGPAQATALGNALVQGIALGRFAGLPAARSSLLPPI